MDDLSLAETLYHIFKNYLCHASSLVNLEKNLSSCDIVFLHHDTTAFKTKNQ